MSVPFCLGFYESLLCERQIKSCLTPSRAFNSAHISDSTPFSSQLLHRPTVLLLCYEVLPGSIFFLFTNLSSIIKLLCTIIVNFILSLGARTQLKSKKKGCTRGEVVKQALKENAICQLSLLMEYESTFHLMFFIYLCGQSIPIKYSV